MAHSSVTLTDPWPGLQGHRILRSQVSQKRHERAIYYRTWIGSRVRSIECYHFRWPGVTPIPGFRSWHF